MIIVELPISVVKSKNLYSEIHCNTVKLLQIYVCSINYKITLQILLFLLCLSNSCIIVVIITTFNFFILMLLNTNVFEVSDFGTLVFTISQLNHFPESFHAAAFLWISHMQWHKHPGTNTRCVVQTSAHFCVCYFCC